MLVAFFALAYVLSWAWSLPLVFAGQTVRPGQAWPTQYRALLGPAAAALVMAAVTTGGLGVRQLLARVLRWRVPVRWWLVTASPVGFPLLALAGMRLSGRHLPAAAQFGQFSGIPPIGLVGVAMLIVAGALGEEIGWRGYALPQLQRRFSPVMATLVLAVLWYAWHLPLSALIANYRDAGAATYVGMLPGLACGAIVLTWLYNRTGSILVAAVWHGLYNVASGTSGAAGTVAAVVSTLVMTQAIVLVVLEVRARRRGVPSVLGPGRTGAHQAHAVAQPASWRGLDVARFFRGTGPPATGWRLDLIVGYQADVAAPDLAAVPGTAGRAVYRVPGTYLDATYLHVRNAGLPRGVHDHGRGAPAAGFGGRGRVERLCGPGRWPLPPRRHTEVR